MGTLDRSSSRRKEPTLSEIAYPQGHEGGAGGLLLGLGPSGLVVWCGGVPLCIWMRP